jgi:hypothetical protein
MSVTQVYQVKLELARDTPLEVAGGSKIVAPAGTVLWGEVRRPVRQKKEPKS